MAEQRTEHVSLLIDRQLFGFWTEVTARRSMDSFSTATFSAPFEPSRPEMRETFRPFTYKPVEMRVSSLGVAGSDFTLFNGTMVGVHPRIEAGERTVDVTAYALPGVLEDCTMPANAVPYEFQKLGLREIARTLAARFGLSLDFSDDAGSIVAKAKLEEEQIVFEFLTDLAKQRNLVLSNTPDGELLCWRSVAPGRPVAKLVEGQPPITTVEASFSPQEYFSQITGFAAAKRGKKGSQYTVQNPHLANVLRPLNFKLQDTDPPDVPTAARAKLGRMFGNIASYTLADIPTWRDPQDDLWEPNTTILLTAPSAMIYRETEFLIRAVTYKQTANVETATLELCLPGAFSGEVPEVLPWME